MQDQPGQDPVLKRVDSLEREIEHLKRDLLRSVGVSRRTREIPPTLFGSVQGGDVTEEMIEQSKHSLFRSFEDASGV